jgi:glycosyltransferase involved in cell wall biosynthesis
MVKSSDIIVTIGICTKNSERTISEALGSLINQDFPYDEMEIIVVDGGSQDKTLSVIRQQLAGVKFKVRFFSENVGLGFARQLVVKHAKGKYVIWVDGDIILSKNYVRQQVNFMQQNPSAGIIVGSFGILPDDNWVAALENMGYVIDSLKHQNDDRETSKLLGTEGAAFRLDAIKQVGGFNPNIRGAQEDIDLAYRIKKAGWKFYITHAVFFERQRATWKALWKQHYWNGYGLHLIQHLHKGRNVISDKSIDRIIFSVSAYKLTHRKIIFLMPLNFVFKKSALLMGLTMAHLDGYGHKLSNLT